MAAGLPPTGRAQDVKFPSGILPASLLPAELPLLGRRRHLRESFPPDLDWSRPPIKVAPIPVFVTPVAPGFHHFGRPFIPAFFPRRNGIFIIDVPDVIETTVTTEVAPAIVYPNPPTVSPGEQSIPGRSADQLAPFDPTPRKSWSVCWCSPASRGRYRLRSWVWRRSGGDRRGKEVWRKSRRL